ncbi:MAG: transglycosylase family protein [Microthrixaceae bacterium]
MKTRRTLSILAVTIVSAIGLSACNGVPDHFSGAISDSGLARLRACESNGNYGVVSASGRYRGAYQFSRTTWNSVARRHYPFLVGVDPAAAHPWDQDRMARALWATAGRGQWPICGRRV